MAIKKVEFLGIIDDSTSALKVSGNQTGGKLIIAFDDSQLAQVIKSVALTKQLLKVTLEESD